MTMGRRPRSVPASRRCPRVCEQRHRWSPASTCLFAFSEGPARGRGAERLLLESEHRHRSYLVGAGGEEVHGEGLLVPPLPVLLPLRVHIECAHLIWPHLGP